MEQSLTIVGPIAPFWRYFHTMKEYGLLSWLTAASTTGAVSCVGFGADAVCLWKKQKEIHKWVVEMDTLSSFLLMQHPACLPSFLCKTRWTLKKPEKMYPLFSSFSSKLSFPGINSRFVSQIEPKIQCKVFFLLLSYSSLSSRLWPCASTHCRNHCCRLQPEEGVVMGQISTQVGRNL